jgi:hypothetical protein
MWDNATLHVLCHLPMAVARLHVQGGAGRDVEDAAVVGALSAVILGLEGANELCSVGDSAPLVPQSRAKLRAMTEC